MRLLTSFPLLFVPVLIYNLIAFGGSVFGQEGVNAAARYSTPLLGVDETGAAKGIVFPTGGEWIITSGDLLLTLGLVLLFIEIVKATSTGRSSIANHAMSMIIFVVCLVEFLLFAPFATSVFFLLTMMTVLDVLAGFTVTIITARRDIAVDEGYGA
jgi:hypothetical protein